jgi:hypothetical protein
MPRSNFPSKQQFQSQVLWPELGHSAIFNCFIQDSNFQFCTLFGRLSLSEFFPQNVCGMCTGILEENQVWFGFLSLSSQSICTISIFEFIFETHTHEARLYPTKALKEYLGTVPWCTQSSENRKQAPVNATSMHHVADCFFSTHVKTIKDKIHSRMGC